jgi:hypothetical protein
MLTIPSLFLHITLAQHVSIQHDRILPCLVPLVSTCEMHVPGQTPPDASISQQDMIAIMQI